MKRLAPLVVMSLLAAVHVSGQELTRTSEEILQLQKTVSNLLSRVAALETTLAAVQTQLAAPPKTVGFKEITPHAYAFDMGPGSTVDFRVAKLTVNADTDISMKSGSTALLHSVGPMIVRADGNLTVRAYNNLDLLGAMVKLNMGSRPALSTGSVINCPQYVPGAATVAATQSSVMIP